MCVLENFQWCGKLCFAGAAFSVDGCRRFPGAASISHDNPNEYFFSIGFTALVGLGRLMSTL
jgi:hypothetical protein